LLALIPTARNEFHRILPLALHDTRSVRGRSSGQAHGRDAPERAMMTGSNCDCLVYRLEKNLIAGLSDETANQDCGHVAPGSVLSRFPGPLDLVRELHAPDDPTDSTSVDALLLELLKQNDAAPPPSVWQRILLLAFIPTIHRTASQVRMMFPSLARDDTAQHVVTVFLEFLGSSEVRARHSHLAFTIARKLRRQAFRWAIRETRGAPPEELERGAAPKTENARAEEPLYAEVVLDEFLDNCQRMGWLSIEERGLLVRFKLDGVTCREIAGRNGHSAAAVRHRIQRLLDRLRRLAHRTQWEHAPEQMELFPIGRQLADAGVPRKKYFTSTRAVFLFRG
jgi:DNA-directed RNA polymerase specialized sigma24 family protein